MNLIRTGIVLRSNAGRVLFRPFNIIGPERPLRLIARILAVPEAEVVAMLKQVLEEFGTRHQKVRDYFLKRYASVQDLIPTDRPLSDERKLLIGAYYTHEYSLEAAALFNPSIVPHPDQNDLQDGTLRFVLSLRATGEGHISSITFRTGTIGREGQITVDVPTRFVTSPDHIPPLAYDKGIFWRKVHELGLADAVAERIVRDLEPHFTVEQLTEEIDYLRFHAQHRDIEFERTASRILNLAKSNYEFFYTPDQPLTERVIFPGSPNESNGIEDARFVRFVENDGQVAYIATYTAYDGRVTIPQILETPDFLHFKISTLNGRQVQGKGMALFPRRIHGLYAMISRQDGENLSIMYSDHLHFWHTRQPLMKPTYAWEFVQIGNCGSPIETEAGWLVLSHGVGPMRKYSIGAFLLDLHDPSKVIGRLPHPLLSPDETEREGYVPNVVYSCGALVHNGILILPYAMSDSASSFATIPLADVLAAMRPVDGFA
ncbi:MAG TPA: glycoside hydrolase family 130 protein [Candidatus Methylacidiphilales bacterium]